MIVEYLLSDGERVRRIHALYVPPLRFLTQDFGIRVSKLFELFPLRVRPLKVLWLLIKSSCKTVGCAKGWKIVALLKIVVLLTLTRLRKEWNRGLGETERLVVLWSISSRETSFRRAVTIYFSRTIVFSLHLQLDRSHSVLADGYSDTPGLTVDLILIVPGSHCFIACLLACLLA